MYETETFVYLSFYIRGNIHFYILAFGLFVFVNEQGMKKLKKRQNEVMLPLGKITFSKFIDKRFFFVSILLLFI